jgi:putative protein-disulfide isomerase
MIEERPALHYFQDTLCGWCFGFEPTLTKIHQTWGASLDLHVYAGGMLTGDRVQPLATKAELISSSYRTIEERCGVTFGERFLTQVLPDGSMMLDSRMPGLALVSYRAMFPDAALNAAHWLHQALYRDGLDLNESDTYRRMAIAFDIEPEAFITLMMSDAMSDALDDEFTYASSLGIEGFPTLLLEHNDNVHVLSYGFTPFEELDMMLQTVFGRREA